jgi:hypothetical protein
MNADLQDQIERLARDFASEVTRLVAGAIVEEVQAALSRAPAASQGSGAGARPRRPRGERRPASQPVERWVPDRRARRVPKFVIEATGLQTKKEIVDRFGEHAIFEKGHPAPPPLRGGPRTGAEA